jgi:hypothetical protein
MRGTDINAISVHMPPAHMIWRVDAEGRACAVQLPVPNLRRKRPPSDLGVPRLRG